MELSKGGGPDPDDLEETQLLAEMERLGEKMKAMRQQAKAAEQGYTFPGMDAVWFAQTPPLRLWHSHGLLCGLAAGFTGVNGYVQLPPDHPWLEMDLQSGGYEDDGLVPWPDVHGGITFGPHVTRWIGWDTGHAFDVWTRQEQDKLWDIVPQRVRDSWAYMRGVEDRVGVKMPGSPGAAGGTFQDRFWTVARVVTQTEGLAVQAVAAQLDVMVDTLLEQQDKGERS